MITEEEILKFKKIRREDCLNFEKFDILYNVDTFIGLQEVKCNIKPLLIFKSKNV
jgi:hypothetical protein